MEITIKQALQQGITAHKEGKLQDAERLYRTILESEPHHPDANHNLGLIAVSVKETEAALSLFKIALDASPKVEQFWVSYIDALIRVKRFENAYQIIDQAKKRGVSRERLSPLEAELFSKAKRSDSESSVPSQELQNNLVGHYQNRRFIDAEKLAKAIIQDFPKLPKTLEEFLGFSERRSETIS